ncbi:TPA: hypothetical protein LGB21_000328, partial [Campylobacter coli]|nr:hypothetical protein [Campylobacter coli]
FKYILERYSFIKYIKYKPNLQLLSALYKAEIEGYKFIKTGKDMALIGHTQDNKWIKPYRCIISIFSKSQFLDESTNEIYIYKIDLFLLLMIKLLRKVKNKNILELNNQLEIFNINNSRQKQYYKFEFFKNQKDFIENHR